MSAPRSTERAAAVEEEYATLEYGGVKQFGAALPTMRWACTYLSPTLRIGRSIEGVLWICRKAETDEVTSEITRLLEEADDE